VKEKNRKNATDFSKDLDIKEKCSIVEPVRLYHCFSRCPQKLVNAGRCECMNKAKSYKKVRTNLDINKIKL